MKKKQKQWLACLLAFTMVFSLMLSVNTSAADTGEQLAITTKALKDAVKGTAYEETLTANGGSGAALTWEIKKDSASPDKTDGTDTGSKGLPPGITLDSKTGKLSGTPLESGTWKFTVTASDGSTTAAQSAFTLNVTEPADPPKTPDTTEPADPPKTPDTTEPSDPPKEPDTTEPADPPKEPDTTEPADPPKEPDTTIEITTELKLADAVVGEKYKAELKASGADTVTWAVKEKSQLPKGLALKDNVISGTPEEAGDFTFTITATAADTSKTAEKEFTLTVKEAEKEEAVAPSITTKELPDGTAGEKYEATLKADGTTPIQWSLENNSALPDGLTLGKDTGIISGTPEKEGTFAFTIAATNEKGTDSYDYSIVIARAEEKLPPVIQTKKLPQGIEGAAYSITLEAESTTPVTWSVQTGSTLPEGLALKEDTITGTPKKAGTYHFTIAAKNAAGTVEQDYELIVLEAAKKPSITTATLPDGTAGTAYKASLKADGTEPVAWKVKDGSALPKGLTLSGAEISGTPEKAGKYTFTLTASNKAGTDEKEYTITIQEAAKKYEVTVTTDGNGTASADITSALPGTKITLKAKAHDGYRFKEWKLIQGNVKIKDNVFTMPKENVTVKAVFEKIPFTYKVTAGGGSVHRIGDGKDLTFTCNGNVKDLTGIYVDKKLVNSSYYTVKSGSTVLTLKAAYLDKLKTGTHTLQFKYSEGSAETTFKVTAKTAAKTGDSTSMQLWFFAAGLALVSAFAILIYKKRRIR